MLARLLRGLSDDSLSGVLVKSLSEESELSAKQLLQVAADTILGATRTPWLALFADHEGGFPRIAVAFEQLATGDIDTTHMPAGSPAVLNSPKYAKPIDDDLDVPAQLFAGADAREDVIALPGSNVLVHGPKLRRLQDMIRKEPGAARALGRFLSLLADQLFADRERRREQVDSEVEHALMSTAATPESTLGLLLDMTLLGFRGQRGLVALVDPNTQEARICAQNGDLSFPDGSYSLDDFGGEWFISILDPNAIAADAGAIYALARECHEQVLILLVASGSGAESLSEETIAKTEQAVEAMRGIVNQMESARRLRQWHRELAESIVTLLDAEEASGVRHHHQVVGHCKWAGRALELDTAAMDALVRAAEVHDIGRAGAISDAGGTAIEFLHPSIGARFLESCGEPEEVCRLVLLHHERADCAGFPRGVSPEEDDLPAWCLISAEAIAEKSVRDGTGGDETRRNWLADEAKAVLPKTVLEKLLASLTDT